MELRILSWSSHFVVITTKMGKVSFLAVILITLAIILDIIANIGGHKNYLGLRALFVDFLPQKTFIISISTLAKYVQLLRYSRCNLCSDNIGHPHVK